MAWQRLIWLAIGLITAAFVINQAQTMITSVRSIASQDQLEQNATNKLKAYREFNMYDNTTVYAQDIVAFLLKYDGIPAVVVRNKGDTATLGIWRKYTTVDYNAAGNEITELAALAATIDLTELNKWFNTKSIAKSSFKSTLVLDAGGTVKELRFVPLD